jgi:hypothetical protein
LQLIMMFAALLPRRAHHQLLSLWRGRAPPAVGGRAGLGAAGMRAAGRRHRQRLRLAHACLHLRHAVVTVQRPDHSCSGSSYAARSRRLCARVARQTCRAAGGERYSACASLLVFRGERQLQLQRRQERRA